MSKISNQDEFFKAMDEREKSRKRAERIREKIEAEKNACPDCAAMLELLKATDQFTRQHLFGCEAIGFGERGPCDCGADALRAKITAFISP